MKMLSSPQVDVHILRSHKNDLTHISGLPPEILATVFRHFIEEQDHPRNGTPTCVIVTHVCRHWRQVALVCPTLWTYIIYTPARWLGTMLERSKNAALVVEYDVTVSLRVCLEQILSQLPRIKVLRLSSLSSLDIDHTIHLLSSQPAPLLEIFEFSVVMLGLPTTKPISNTTFQGQAPRLRSVGLTSCNFSWTACIFSGLRTLCVRGTGTTSYPTLPQLLSALRRMPALEQLTLEQLSIIPEETKLLAKVPLARLKSVALGAASIRTAASLFAQLALPVDTKIALQLTQIQGVQDFSDLFSAMDRHPDRSDSVVRSLRAIHLSPRSFCVQFSTLTAINTVYSWNPRDDDIRLSIQFTCTSAEVEAGIIFDICRLVTRDRIQKFSFGSEFDLPGRDFWRSGSSFLLDLEIIHVSSSLIGGLIAALEIIEGKRNSDIAYPSLRVLELEAINFEEDEPEELQDVIKIRAKHGAPIHTLRLTECRNLKVDEVQGFREAVATVDWDEYDDLEIGSLGDANSDSDCSSCG